MRKFATVAAACALLGLGACTAPSSSSNLATFLSQLANTVTADLTNAESIANAATPPDTIGATCYTGLLTEQAVVQKMMGEVSGSTVGVFSANEIARVLGASGAQQTQIRQSLEVACAPLVADEAGAIANSGSFFSELASIAKLAAAT